MLWGCFSGRLDLWNGLGLHLFQLFKCQILKSWRVEIVEQARWDLELIVVAQLAGGRGTSSSA